MMLSLQVPDGDEMTDIAPVKFRFIYAFLDDMRTPFKAPNSHESIRQQAIDRQSIDST
jgi:hypothetical protein